MKNLIAKAQSHDGNGNKSEVDVFAVHCRRDARPQVLVLLKLLRQQGVRVSSRPSRQASASVGNGCAFLIFMTDGFLSDEAVSAGGEGGRRGGGAL